jgi:hypothetical protein
MKIRIVIASVAVAVAIAGVIYGAWAMLDAILKASPLAQFIISTSGAGAGSMAAYLSAKQARE